METRVVITGLGTVNAIGNNVPECLRSLESGICGIGPVTRFDPGAFRTGTGGEVRRFDPRATIPPSWTLKRTSHADRMALAASIEALRQAGLFPLPATLQEDTGVAIGGGAGGMLECEATYRRYLRRGAAATPFSPFAAFCCAASADGIASRLALYGPRTSFMTACSSGATALGFAADLIRRGQARVMLAGGTEPLCRITYAAFNALKAVDPDPCRPFDRQRRGLSLGEGAGIMVLEALEHAAARGAPILAEFLGYGLSCDAHHMTAPDPEGVGAVRCMQAALADAGAHPEQVDHINAHGTATPANDRMETRAIREVFGARAEAIPVSATKSMTGHTLGAAGAIEGLICALAIARGVIPPTLHLTDPDPECDLDYVTEGARRRTVHVALSNSFAFGGNNTALLLGRYTPRGVLHE
jgi:3-oxoacyl-[acyl-carrier-protein] synthase II